jgi:acetyl esterase/lipase
MRLIRSRARELRIDPARIGIMGFSAGGHLAADLAVSHAARTYAHIDAADALPARPAFAALVYPVTTLAIGMTHGGSRDNLLGPTPSAQLIAARSPLNHVGSVMPPCFLVHAMDDATVPVANSLAWITACQKANVSVEAHLFAEGGHGFGLHLPPDNPGSRWPDLFALWVRKHGG